MIVKPHKMPSNKEQNNGKRANTNKGPAKGSKSLLILFSENYTRVVVLVKKTQGYEKKKKFSNFQIRQDQFFYLKTQPTGALKLPCAQFL